LQFSSLIVLLRLGNPESTFSCSTVSLIDILLKLQQHTFMCFTKFSLNSETYCFCATSGVRVIWFYPLLDDGILRRQGVVKGTKRDFTALCLVNAQAIMHVKTLKAIMWCIPWCLSITT